MSTRKEAIDAVYKNAYATIFNDDMDVRFDDIRKHVLENETLTEEEKIETIKRFDNDHDYFKVVWEAGSKRICEICQKSCFARFYCEFCIRNYLEGNFSNWASGNTDIDNLIKRCQRSSLIPYMIVEWIPYNKFQNIKYLTKGGCSEIYSADWIDGCYKEWNREEKELKRGGKCKVVLKRLENVEEANRDWLEEAETHLILSNKWGNIVQCFGLSKDPSNGKYILVMNYMDMDLRKFILENRNKITWKTKIQIIFEVIKALRNIHSENSIHRDLHSGNVLFSRERNEWYISDLGFCGPANKPLKSVYGNLPYIAPETLSKSVYSFKSDIYSVAMLMWELSAEQPPFTEYGRGVDLAINIINGMRPTKIPGTPSEYMELMTECWDAEPSKRPDSETLWKRVESKYESIHKDDSYWNSTSNSPLHPNFNINNLSSTIMSSLKTHSRIYNFNNLPDPKNATQEEQDYYSTQLNFNIPDVYPIINLPLIKILFLTFQQIYAGKVCLKKYI